MRRMIIQLDQSSIRQFRCSNCDWVFYVQQPVTPEISVEFQRSYAQRWFAAHKCPAGSCGAASAGRNSQPSTENMGAGA